MFAQYKIKRCRCLTITGRSQSQCIEPNFKPFSRVKSISCEDDIYVPADSTVAAGASVSRSIYESV